MAPTPWRRRPPLRLPHPDPPRLGCHHRRAHSRPPLCSDPADSASGPQPAPTPTAARPPSSAPCAWCPWAACAHGGLARLSGRLRPGPATRCDTPPFYYYFVFLRIRFFFSDVVPRLFILGELMEVGWLMHAHGDGSGLLVVVLSRYNTSPLPSLYSSPLLCDGLMIR